MAVIGVLAIHAEGRHLEGLVVVHHRECAMLKARLDHMTISEDPLHFMRQRIGAYVPILGNLAQECIADASAHNIALIAGILQPFEHKFSARWQLPHGISSLPGMFQHYT